MRLTAQQIAQYAAAAGFTGPDLGTAVAIALAESAGYTNAKNTDGESSWGLWQINVQAHPEYSPALLLDPMQNARAAFAIYSAAGRKFRDWTTYNNGAYLAYLEQPIGSAPVYTGTSSPTPGLAIPLDSSRGGLTSPLVIAGVVVGGIGFLIWATS